MDGSEVVVSNDIGRRAILRAAALGSFALGTPAVSSKLLASISIDRLQVDHLDNPLAIEGAEPRLSWRAIGFSQASYRVRVASSASLLRSGRADLWDSTRTPGNTAFDVAYLGKTLRPKQQAFWQIEAWTATGRRVVSPMASWRAGLLSPSDWGGEWLAAESNDIAGDRAARLAWIWSSEPKITTPLCFRRIFPVGSSVSGAVLQVVARDAIDGVWLNGRPMDRPYFGPKSVNNTRMETIALPVVPGVNELIVMASYRPTLGPPSPSGGLAAVIRLHHADGNVERSTTADGWRVAPWSGVAGEPPRIPATSWGEVKRAASQPANDPWAAGPAMLLRRQVIARTGIASAIVYATALGAYYLHVNGKRVGRAVLAPESTDFSQRVQYQAYDVTGLIRPGDNMIGAIVGDGWYGSTGLFGGRYDFGPAPCRFLAHLSIEYADGSRQEVVTDGGWQTALSPILSSEIYDGEVYDARLENRGWDRAGTSSVGWVPATRAETPVINVSAQVDPPIEIVRTLPPIAIKEIAPGKHVVDFGQNFAGWCRILGAAPSGTSITLRYAEVLHPSGEVDQSNLRSALARDTYIFSGAEREEYRPHFSYHGFRYVQVEGWNGPLPEDLLLGEVIHTALPETGLFKVDDPLIQKLWLNTLWSQRSNFVGSPTDCPQRDERLGWMGDAQVFWDAASFNMDVSTFTRRFMRDVRDGQSATGQFADFNPQSRLAGMKGSPGWADAGILLPWTSWQRYGDTAIIDENWAAMLAYADQIMAANPDFVWRNQRGVDYGDWLALDAKQPGDPTTPKELVATAYWFRTTSALVDMARATGRMIEAERLDARAGKISDAYAKAFVGADGRIGNDSQTGYILSLKFGLVPPALRSQAGQHLVAGIIDRGTLLSTGFLGTPAALDVLLDLDHRQLVRTLLKRTQFPSWGYMVARGATTIWERWNGDTGDVAMNSFNHYALGAIVGFFYRRIAGISNARPGFSQIVFAPDVWLGFGSASATYDSQVGRIESAWSRDGAGITLNVLVPDNAGGLLKLPAGTSRSATLNGERIERSNEIYDAVLPAGRHAIRVFV